jgi:hypothetical protein
MPSDAPPFSQALKDRIVDDLSSARPRSSKMAAAGRTFASSRSKHLERHRQPREPPLILIK